MARRYSDPELLGTLELWVVNQRGAISNEAWRKRHAHEPHYIEQREEQILKMDELARLLRVHIDRTAAKEAAQ